jgi:arylsulfatase A-like enzyme
MDHSIGRLMETLKCMDCVEDTIVIFASDNGAKTDDVYEDTSLYPGRYPKMPRTGSNDPLRGCKAQAYEGGIRTPALVSWPGTVKPRRIDTPMHIVDWFATFAAMLGRDIYDDEGLDGVDIMSILKDDAAPEERALYWNINMNCFAVRKGAWKLLVNADRASGKTELYNIDEDPRERVDLSEKQPALVAELEKELARCRERDASLLHPEVRDSAKR